jgi:hypothetical protein
MGSMRILTVSQLVGISSDWIRKAERAGLLPPAQRDRAGHRRYREEDIERIRAVLFSPRRRPMGAARKKELRLPNVERTFLDVRDLDSLIDNAKIAGGA